MYQGLLFELEKQGGLLLDIGKKHTVHFHSQHCEDEYHSFLLESNSQIRLVFDCRSYKPSTLYIASNEQAEILVVRGGNSSRLGVTNQHISYQMTHSNQTLSLLIVAQNQPPRSIQVKLTAGKTSKCSILNHVISCPP